MKSRLRPAAPAAASPGRRRDGEVEGGAAAGPGAFHPHLPPISSASRLLMARPRPVPPYLRVVLLSAWLNFWNSRLLASSRQADAGVAHRKVQQGAVLARLGNHAQHHLAGFGEFHRVAQQVEQDLAQPRHVAVDDGRHLARAVALEDIGDVEVLLGRTAGIRSSADSTQSRRSKGWASMSMRPASIFEKSRMSLMIVSSASPLVADRRRVVALLGVQRRVQQQPAHADDGVHRRADLVAHRRQEGALGLVGSLGGSACLALALRAAQLLERAQDDGADERRAESQPSSG